MTTYRIRPLVWRRDKYCATAFVTDYIGYMAFPDGTWAGSFYRSDRPYGREANLDAAKSACESHWRGVLSAALEPVEGA